jgi:hypothetical protein
MEHFPEVLVPGYETLIAVMRNNSKDRHVRRGAPARASASSAHQVTRQRLALVRLRWQ